MIRIKHIQFNTNTSEISINGSKLALSGLKKVRDHQGILFESEFGQKMSAPSHIEKFSNVTLFANDKIYFNGFDITERVRTVAMTDKDNELMPSAQLLKSLARTQPKKDDDERERRAARILSLTKYADPKQLYLKEHQKLKDLVERINHRSDYTEIVPSQVCDAKTMQKRRHASWEAMRSTTHLIKEIDQQFSLINFSDSKLSAINKQLLFRLASICSIVSNGLRFIAGPDSNFVIGEAYPSFEYRLIPSSGAVLPASQYTLDTHKNNMQNLRKLASQLDGYRWKLARNILYTIAAGFLISALIFATVSTQGMALAGIYGGISLVSAGMGFFAGRDTRLAKAVREIKLETIEKTRTTQLRSLECNEDLGIRMERIY